MKAKSQPVTLENIGRLIGQKLVPVFGELDGLKQQLTQVDNKVEAHRKETKNGFDEVYSTIQEGLGDLSEETDKKIKAVSLLQRV